MAAKGMVYFVVGSAIVCYVAIAAFCPDEKKIKGLDGLEKSASGGKLSPSDIIRIASDSGKPFYRLNKKEIDELIKAQQNK